MVAYISYPKAHSNYIGAETTRRLAGVEILYARSLLAKLLPILNSKPRADAVGEHD